MSEAAVHVALLGGFRVRVDGREVPSAGWPLRRAAELVQLLALGRDRRLLRDQVVETLWPHLSPEAGAANLRKAAHHARQVLADPGAVVLRGGGVALFPDRVVGTDVEDFEGAADAGDWEAAVALYGGELLPDALYEEWTQTPRDRLRSRYLEVLRRAGDWPRLARADPTDEAACRELMTAALAAGNRHAAIRWYGRLRAALEAELGLRPAPETEALYERCVAGLRRPDRTLVGREVALAEADAALNAAAEAEISALVVRGPGGIGKTTLCREVAATAHRRGWTVVPVRAAPDAGPYAPLVAAVDLLLGRDPTLANRVPGRTRSVLAELSMLVRPGEPLDGPVTRHQVIGAVRRLLTAAADGGRAVLVVDDAHLADDDAAEALLHVAGAGTAADPFLVLAHRAGRAPDALARGLDRLHRAGLLSTIELAPLDRAEASALVAAAASAPLDPHTVGRIVDVGEGNPFFLLELARGGGPVATTPTVRDAVTARFVELDAGSRAVLQRLAVAGDELDPAGVLAVTGLPEDEAFSVLDAALAADVLVVSGSRYRFRHELVRQALVEQVAPHRRFVIHREAARRLATAGGTPDAIATHWLAGGLPTEAAPWLVIAARGAVRLGAFGDALRQVDILLAHRPDHGEARSLRAQALEALGDERAPAAYAAAARVADEADRDDLLAKQALAAVRAGDPAGAMAVLEGVAARTLDGRLAQALALCGAAAMGFAEPAVGVAQAAEIRALAVESGEPAAVMIASWAEAAAAHAGGNLPRTLRAVLRDTATLPDLAIALFDGQLCVAERLLYGNQPYPEVIAFADGLEAEAERLGAARGRAFATTFRGEARLLTGQLDAAETDLERGVRLHRAIGAAGGEALSLQRLAEVALHRGDPSRAARLLDDALDVARESDLGFHLFDRIYGTRITAATDPARAMAALEEAEDAVHGSMETCPGCRISLAVPAAIASARAGDLRRASDYEAKAHALTTVLMRQPGWYAAVEEVSGHRAAATGDRSDAHRHLRAAADGFRLAGHPLDAARCDRAADDWR